MSVQKQDVVHEGQIHGAFRGFHSTETLFAFTDGSKWRQAVYHYHYHYAYMPSARIVNNNGRQCIEVDGVNASVEVRRVR